MIESAIEIVGITLFLVSIKVMVNLLKELASLKFAVEPELPPFKDKNLFNRILKAVVERAEIASLSELSDPPADLYDRNKNNINECQVIVNHLNSCKKQQDISNGNVIELHRIRPNR